MMHFAGSTNEWGSLSGVVSQFREAIRIEPNNATAHRNLADSYQQRDGPDDAFREFNRPLVINPDDADSRKHLEYTESRIRGGND